MKKIAGFLSVVVVVAMFSGCMNDGKKTEKNTIQYQMDSKFEQLDPVFAVGTEDETMVLNLFDGLVEADETGKVKPKAAKQWNVSEDGKTYLFELKEALQFSDGSPLKASDFVYAYQRGVDPQINSPRVEDFYPIKNGRKIFKGELPLDQLGVVAESDTKLKIEFESSDVMNLLYLTKSSFSPVKKEVVQNNLDWWKKVDTLISNGTFSMTEMVDGASYFMERNQYDTTTTSTLKGVRFLVMNDPAEISKKYEEGTLDILSTNLSQKEQKERKLFTLDLPSTFYLLLNADQGKLGEERYGVFSKKEVRKALGLAIDREQIVTDVLKGQGKATMTMVPSFIQQKNTINKPDIPQAQQLLKDAGYPEGQGIPPLELRYTGEESVDKILEQIVSTWAKTLGVKVSLVKEDVEVFAKNRAEGNFQITRGEVVGLPHPYEFLKQFQTDNFFNFGKFKHGEFDQLLKQNPDKLEAELFLENLEKAEKVLLEEGWVIPLYRYSKNYIVNENIQGMTATAFGGLIFDQATFR